MVDIRYIDGSWDGIGANSILGCCYVLVERLKKSNNNNLLIEILFLKKKKKKK
jgi:hypothetical protein